MSRTSTGHARARSSSRSATARPFSRCAGRCCSAGERVCSRDPTPGEHRTCRRDRRHPGPSRTRCPSGRVRTRPADPSHRGTRRSAQAAIQRHGFAADAQGDGPMKLAARRSSRSPTSPLTAASTALPRRVVEVIVPSDPEALDRGTRGQTQLFRTPEWRICTTARSCRGRRWTTGGRTDAAECTAGDPDVHVPDRTGKRPEAPRRPGRRRPAPRWAAVSLRASYARLQEHPMEADVASFRRTPVWASATARAGYAARWPYRSAPSPGRE